MINRKLRRARKAMARGSQANQSSRRLVFRPHPQKHLLLAGTALATGVIAGGFLLASSSMSHANDECGDIDGFNNPVVNCSPFTGSPYNDGVEYNRFVDNFSGDLTVNLEDAFITDDDSSQDAALRLINTEDITVNGLGSFNQIGGTGQNAIWITTLEDGNITVNGINGQVTMMGSGVGHVSVPNATTTDAIVLNTEDGDINLTLFQQDVVQSWENAVFLSTEDGNIEATNNGTIAATDGAGGGGHGIWAQVLDGNGTIKITNNSLDSIHADKDGIHAEGMGGQIDIINGEGLEPHPDGLIDALEDGIWAQNDAAGNIFVWNGTTSNSLSQIYAGGQFGIYANSVTNVYGPNYPGHVEAYNLGLIELWGEDGIAGIHVETTGAEDGYAAAFNGAVGIPDEKEAPFNVNARVNAYDFFVDDSSDNPYDWRAGYIAHQADGIETVKDGGEFYQHDLKSYTPHGIPYSTGELLFGGYGGGYGGPMIGEWFGGGLPFLGGQHAFSTVARNYGTWDFTGYDHYLTPGFDEGGKHVYNGARTIGGVFAPGASNNWEDEDAGGNAWENWNLSNANSGLWNYGTMIGNGRPSCYSKDDGCEKVPGGAPVLRSVTQHFDYSSDSYMNGETFGGPNFLYIYNAGYIEHDYYPDLKVKSDEAGPYSFEDQSFATYGVIGSEDTPSSWRFDPQFAFNTNFGFQTAGGVDWDFVDNVLIGEDQLGRFGSAAGDRLLEAYGPDHSGGAGILMVNDGLLIGTVKEQIDDGANILASLAGGFGGFEDGPGLRLPPISSLHINSGTWFTRGWNGFLGTEDAYLNFGLVQSAFGKYEHEWTTFKDLETSANLGGIYSLLDGGTEDQLTFGGDYYGGVPYLPLLAFEGEPEPNGAPGYDLSFLERGYFALDAFLAEEYPEEGPDPTADFFNIKGYLGGSTGLIIRNANEFGSQGVNWEGIPVVGYHEVGLLNGGGCAYEDGAVCREGDSMFISLMTPGSVKEGADNVIVDGLYDWRLVHFSDNYGLEDVVGKGWEDINGQFRLVSDFGGNSARLPGVVYGGQQIWYELLRVAERSRNQEPSGGGGADLNTDFSVADYGAPSSSGPSSGLWAKAGGSWIETDTSLTQNMITYDTSFDQDIYSILGGADMKPGGADSPYQIGVFGGYVTSDVDFNAGAPGTSVDYEGGSLGAYLNYVNGAFFADALVKGEYLDTTYSLGGGFGDVNTDLWNIGVMANTGYRMTMGSAFLEPLASFAYVHTNVDDGSGGGGSVDFSNGTSLRAGAGARVGTVMATGNATTEVSLLGQIWNEFEGDNEVTVSGMGGTETFTDDTSGVFGEAEAVISVTNSDGSLSGFLSGGGKWGENFNSWNAQVGIRKGF